MTETAKTCTHCARPWPATTEFFQSCTRKSRDGAKNWTFLLGKCRECQRVDQRARRLKQGDAERELARQATARSRTKNGRPDRSAENAAKRERAALKNGFPSLAAWDEHQSKLKAERELKLQQREEAAMLADPPCCWLWNKPGLTLAEKFRVRYHLDDEFRAAQIDKTRRRKPHLKQATPPWVDLKAMAGIYAARPDGHHVDHIVPIKGITHDGRRVSGLNVPWNLRYLPASDNIRRSNRMTAEELAEHERCNQGCDPYNPANGTHSDQRSSAAPRHQ